MSEEIVRKLLYQDLMERRERKFDLLSGDDLIDYLRGEKDDLSTPPFFIMEKNHVNFVWNKDEKPNYQSIIQKLGYWEKIAINLVKRHRGNLALCGGNALRLLHRGNLQSHKDCDFFFYDTTPENAEKIIVECISYLSRLLQNHDMKTYYDHRDAKGILYGTRNKHTVNVVVQ